MNYSLIKATSIPSIILMFIKRKKPREIQSLTGLFGTAQKNRFMTWLMRCQIRSELSARYRFRILQFSFCSVLFSRHLLSTVEDLWTLIGTILNIKPCSFHHKLQGFFYVMLGVREKGAQPDSSSYPKPCFQAFFCTILLLTVYYFVWVP